MNTTPMDHAPTSFLRMSIEVPTPQEAQKQMLMKRHLYHSRRWGRSSNRNLTGTELMEIRMKVVEGNESGGVPFKVEISGFILNISGSKQESMHRGSGLLRVAYKGEMAAPDSFSLPHQSSARPATRKGFPRHRLVWSPPPPCHLG